MKDLKRYTVIMLLFIFLFGCSSGVEVKKELNSELEIEETEIKVEEQVDFREEKRQNKKYEIFGKVKKEYSLDFVKKSEIFKKLEEKQEVFSLAYSPDGKYLASGNKDSKIMIWDIDKQKMIKMVEGHKEKIYSLSYSPNGKYLVSGGLDSRIKIWDTSTWKVIKTIKNHVAGVRSIKYSPDGRYLASGSDDGSVIIWDTSNWKKVKMFISSYQIMTLDFSPNGKYLAEGGTNYVKIWDTSTWKEIKTLKGKYNYTMALSFDSAGKYLIAGDFDGNIKIWETKTWVEAKTIKAHSKKIRTIVAGHNYLASGSDDGSIIIWDASSWEKIKTIENPDGKILSLAYSPDGKYLASGSQGDSIKIWRDLKVYVNKGRTKNQISIEGKEKEITGILPQNIIVEFCKELGKIYTPIKGLVGVDNIESMYTNNDTYLLYTFSNTPVYIDAHKKNFMTNIAKGRIMNSLYYSKELDMFYIEEEELKGWVEPENISYLQKANVKLAVVKNSWAYDVIGGARKNSYSSGDVLNSLAYDEIEGYYYLDNGTWIEESRVLAIDESKNTDRIFAARDEVEFNYDFTGNNYKNISIGTEFKLLGIAGEYCLLESTSTKERGWASVENMSRTKPDLNDPAIIITNTEIKDSILTIEGKIYDDTAVASLLLNGNKISINSLDKFDKIQYVPEAGYSFKSKVFLIEGMENNIELKVVDREGKSYSKTLSYNPQLKDINLNEFKLENIIVKEVPQLEYSIKLKDENDDGILTGSEKMTLTVTVKNIGKGSGQNVKLKINNPSGNQVSYRKNYMMGTIKSGESKTAHIDFVGQDNLEKAKASYELMVEEQNGFNPFPANFSFNVEAKSLPKLEIIDYAIDDESKNGQIEQGEKFDIYVVIQNTGEGSAREVIFDISKKVEGIINMSENTFKFEKLESGESIKIKSSFITNYKYKGDGSLPFELSLYEDFSKKKEIKEINLVMNKAVPTIKELNLEAKTKNIEKAEKISVISDIDIFIDEADVTKEDNKKWAVIIGIEDYRKAVSVQYAKRDAQTVKKYFNKLMGVPEYNIFHLENNEATLGEVRVILQDKLQGRVKEGDTVYFYFSGHGIPTNEGDTYLLLHDSDPASPRLTAYKVEDIYRDLGMTKADNSYLFIDSCFAGGTSRGEEVESLLEGSRPGLMRVKDEALKYDNLKVFNATDTNQLSNSYQDQAYGLFTYYLLKGLGGDADNDKDRNINVEELKEYLEENVSEKSRVLYGESRYQKPTFKGRRTNEVLAEY